MKNIIFAGGGGKRFWPISRENQPKQFIKLIENTSTFQMMVSRIQPVYGWHSIYVSTNEQYVYKVKEQIPEISTSNIITEPARRDLGPSVGLSLIKLRKLGVTEPISILWADHFISNTQAFQEALKVAEGMILQKKAKIIFMGEKPLFANANFGWINIDNKDENNIAGFNQWSYRPSQKDCDEMFSSGKWIWNTGYFFSTVDFLLECYQKFKPELYNQLIEIEKALDTPSEAEVIEKIYPQMEIINFDAIVPYNVEKEDAKVICTDMGWQDPGTLYALKKYFALGEENYINGNGYLKNSTDTLIFNSENKLITGIELNGVIIINTPDVLFVTTKEGALTMKDLLADLEKDKKFKKYL